MQMKPIMLGDRHRRGSGWLVISEGAVRAVLTPGEDGVYFGFACDQRVRPENGYEVFSSLDEAQHWMTARLEPRSPSTPKTPDNVEPPCSPTD